MPGPGKKHKGKAKTKAKGGGAAASASQSTAQTQIAVVPKVVPCMTLDEDEITRCGNPATEGYPHPERCKVHHTQYDNMYKTYKDASKVVDEIAKGGLIPTAEQIAKYTVVSVVLDKARFVRRYIEAIRVERIGRDIHSKRFFLKVDDGHKMRIKVLAKEMIRGVDAFDSLQARAFKLHTDKNPRPDWANAAAPPTSHLPSTSDIVDGSLQRHVGGSTKAIPKAIEAYTSGSSGADEPSEQDLIDLELRRQKANLLHAFEFFMDPDAVALNMEKRAGRNPIDAEKIRRESVTALKILQQYALRVIFYDPSLFTKAEGKVSLKDLILSDDFSLDDLARFAILFGKKLEIGLLWMKDCVIEALTISSAGLSANVAGVGDPKNRIKILDGWIYNVPHKKASNEAWFRLIDTVGPVPANIENRFVRLCNSYDDLISVLSFGALGSIPPPSFCREAVTYRNHLSLSGVVIADMSSSPKPPEMSLFPSNIPARRPENRTWGQMETRAYIFGVIRNEPDAFTDAFLNELKARPDLFQVIIRSETDPGQEIEVFGAFPTEPIAAMRARNFEAPRSIARPSDGHGEWMYVRSAKDILYGTDSKLLGYLTELNRGVSSGWFFHFKKFKVKYIVIMDALPNRHHKFVAQQVAWAALRAGGYAKGDFNEKKYAAASNALFDKCAKERLGWLPDGSWSTTKM